MRSAYRNKAIIITSRVSAQAIIPMIILTIMITRTTTIIIMNIITTVIVMTIITTVIAMTMITIMGRIISTMDMVIIPTLMPIIRLGRAA